ncbi:hydrogenase subunit MbhD domain-containing protein [Rhodohalobacter sp. 8-1]|uniref:hydrogenase subunit MbhD domain-containing protein n=1 Tax=Rhodohalobacter sp. 8-1 TaxID=3131972 RepID=UPI0030EEC483
MIWELELVLFIFLLISAIVALEADDLLVSVVMMTIFSFIIALLFTVMGAIDVGFTEAVVGAGVTGVLFIVVIYQTSRKTND